MRINDHVLSGVEENVLRVAVAQFHDMIKALRTNIDNIKYIEAAERIIKMLEEE